MKSTSTSGSSAHGEHRRLQVGRHRFEGLDQAVVGRVVVGDQLLRSAAGVLLADPVVDLVDIVVGLEDRGPRRRGLGLATAKREDSIDRPLAPPRQVAGHVGEAPLAHRAGLGVARAARPRRRGLARTPDRLGARRSARPWVRMVSSPLPASGLGSLHEDAVDRRVVREVPLPPVELAVVVDRHGDPHLGAVRRRRCCGTCTPRAWSDRARPCRSRAGRGWMTRLLIL